MSNSPECVPLAECIAKVVGGGTPSRAVPSNWVGSVPWASVKDLAQGELILDDTQEHISEGALGGSSANLIPAGIPIVCTRMAVGRIAMPSVDMAINQDLKALFPARGVDPRYLLRAVDFLQPQLEALASGSTVKGIQVRDLLSLPVPKPPLPTQRRIVEILETLDSEIRHSEAVLDKRTKMREGMITEAIFRSRDSCGTEESALGDLLLNGPSGAVIGPFGSNLTANDYRSAGVPIIFVRDIQSGHLAWKSDVYVSPDKAQELSAHVSEPGDILVTKMGDPPGTAAMHDDRLTSAVITADVIRLRADVTKVSTQWLWIFLNSPLAAAQVRAMAGGVTRQKVTLRDFRTLRVSTPSRSTQEQLAGAVRAADALIAKEQEAVAKLRRIRSGLISDVFTGRFRDMLRVPA